MSKKIVFLLLFLFSPFVFPALARAESTPVLVINQLRGKEACCQSGTTDLISAVKSDEDLNKLPIAWALRFDFLTENDLTSLFDQSDKLGLLLEVTPSLSEKSGVSYKGNDDGSDWYFAKNSFLVGYSVAERKKLIDTAFAAFKEKFGYYPSFTVSWMIDAWSLDYLHSRYQVVLHEITKEQYETDSYTLYGGIFNAPYYPSRRNPLLPGKIGDKIDMLVVRQTVSDFLRNYGSPKSYYTSQPNDYLLSKDKLNFAYFTGLIKDLLEQPNDYKLAVLGFENSFSWEKYGSEYLKQLKYLFQLGRENKVTFYGPQDFYRSFPGKGENKAFYFLNDFNPEAKTGVLWYFGRNYRARVLVKDGLVLIDDLRSYTAFDDPYRETPVLLDYAYWIVPYLIDGSSQYTLSSKEQMEVKSQDFSYSSVLPDFLTSPFGLVFGQGNFKTQKDGENFSLVFKDDFSQKVTFSPEGIILESGLNPYFNYQKENVYLKQLLTNASLKKNLSFPNLFAFSIVRSGENSLDLGWERENKFAPLFALTEKKDHFELKAKEEESDLSFLSPQFQPDKSDLTVDSGKSIFYWNNKVAIAGRNPLRLFILPLNSLGRPTSVSEVKVSFAHSNGEIDVAYPQDYSYRITPWFIDLTSAVPLSDKITLSVDGVVVIKGERVEFITDCKKNLGQCLTSGAQIIQYIVAIVGEKLKDLPQSFPNL